MNPLRVADLFGALPTTPAAIAARLAAAKSTGLSFAGKDAQCVDFAGFDLAAYLHPEHASQYAHLDRWNLDGARLNGSSLRFTSIADATLRGAVFDAATLGYTMITGTADRFTKAPSLCQTAPPDQISCFK